MKKLVVAILFGIKCLADQAPEPPVCTAELNGRFWPDEANTSRELARQLTQSGELQICTYVVPRFTLTAKYKWQHLSVNAKELAKAKAAKSPE